MIHEDELTLELNLFKARGAIVVISPVDKVQSTLTRCHEAGYDLVAVVSSESGRELYFRKPRVIAIKKDLTEMFGRAP